MKIILIIFIFAIANLFSIGNKLTLEECIEFAQRESPAARISRAQYNSRVQSYRAFQAGFLPQLSLNGSVPGLLRDINQIIQPDGSVRFIEQSQLVSSANLSISQTIAATGSRISVGSGVSRLDVFGNNEYTSWRAAPLAISFNQNLLGFFAERWDTKIEKLNISKAKEELTVAMEQLSMDIANRYFNAYIAKIQLENTRKNVDYNDTLYILSKGRFSVGKIAENDLLQSELALLNSVNSLENAEINYLEAMEQLFIAIGYFGDINDFEISPDLNVEFLNIDVDIAIDEAIENRPDITDFKIRELQADRTIDRIESDNGFNASLSASYGLNQTAPEFQQSLRDLLEQERLNINFSIPLFQWGLAGSRMESALAEKDIIKTDIERSMRNFETNIKYQAMRFDQLQKQVELSEKAEQIAQRRFEVSKNRLNNNMIDLNSFFIAQSEKDNAVTNYVRTIRDYWIAYYNLRMMTLYDFKENQKISYEIR